MAEIHLRSQGIPRVINGVCDNLLLSAFAAESKTCTVDMLDEVCRDMRLEWPGSRRLHRSRTREETEALQRTPYSA